MVPVPAGEIVVGPCKTLFMDEISTGLDSSTTYQIVSCIRNMVRMRNVSAWTFHRVPRFSYLRSFSDRW